MARTVELAFFPQNLPGCPKNLDPVCGLEGSFSGFSPGTWTFFCNHDELKFSLKFNADGIETTRDIIYVNADNFTLSPDGYSWETSMISIRHALSVAEYGSEIRIAQGTYVPSFDGNRNATFKIPAGVKLKGGYRGMPAPQLFSTSALSTPDPGERDIDGFPTILSGDINGLWQSGDYHLNGLLSPCLDAGDPLFLMTGTDIDGDPRIIGP